MGSTRLPGKVLRLLGERSVLAWTCEAAAAAGLPVIVATTTGAEDDGIALAGAELGAAVTRGPAEDVLARYVVAIDENDLEVVVRLTADCPLLDPAVIRACVTAFDSLDVDYLSTIHPRSLPRGLDVEVASAEALTRAGREATGHHRAHVTSYLYASEAAFTRAGLVFDPPADHHRLTLDTPEDGALLDAVVGQLGPGPHPWRRVVDLLVARPDIAGLNADVRQKALEEG